MGIRSYIQQAVQSTVYYGSNVNKTTLGVIASGGTIIDDAGFRIHVFTSPGSFVVTSGGTVEYVVVAGGGGCSSTLLGGGGGAGGFRTANGFPVTATTYPITVGAGGVGSPTGGFVGFGNPSTFSTITSDGGGRAGTSGNAGGAGGSGGGAAADQPTFFGPGNSPPTSPPQGNPGGSGLNGTPVYGGGGGGGASAAGNPGLTSPNPSKGGDGSPITWIPASYGTPGPAPGRYFAGGGGGATYLNPGAPGGGLGGAGGGGGGGALDPALGSVGSNGGVNTGGGSGGSSSGPGGSSLTGGSGIVIIRYQL